MLEINLKILLLAALVPLVIGFVWYNKNVFGTAWMKATGMTEEDGKTANMPLIFGLTYLFSFFLAFAMQFMVIHQFHLYSLWANDPTMMQPGSEINNLLTDLMTKYGNNFRTFKHGVLHGVIGGFTIALPILGVNALFEKKGFKYIAINVGFWIVSMALMGGIICAWT